MSMSITLSLTIVLDVHSYSPWSMFRAINVRARLQASQNICEAERTAWLSR